MAKKPCHFYITQHSSSNLCWRQACLKLRNVPLFIALVAVWGSNYSVVKMALGFASATAFLVIRFAISVVILVPVFLVLKKMFPRDKGTLRALCAYGLLYAIVNGLQIYGMVGEGSGVSAVIVYTQPLFVLWLAAPFLKERITAPKILGAAIGFVGVALLFLNKTGSFAFESGLILVATAFLWAVSTIYYKKYLCDADPFVAIFLQMIFGTVIFAGMGLATSSLAVPMNLQYAELILYSAVGSLALGNVLWLRLLSDEEATTLSSSVLLVPAVALVFGWLFINESLGFFSLLGSFLTLAGVFLANVAAKRSCPTPRST